MFIVKRRKRGCVAAAIKNGQNVLGVEDHGRCAMGVRENRPVQKQEYIDINYRINVG